MRVSLLLALLSGGCAQWFDPSWDDEGPTLPEPTPPGDDDAADDDDSAAPGPAPIAVHCHGPTATVENMFGTPASVTLSATLQWSDGSETSAPGISWVIADGFGGSITPAGVYTLPPDHGGAARVEAWFDELSDTCEFDIHLSIVEDGTGDAGLAQALLSASPAPDSSCAPTVLYPEDGALGPRNLSPPRFQWSAGAGRLDIANDYASGVFLGVDAATPSAAAWAALIEPRNGDALAYTISGATWDGVSLGPLCSAPPRTLPLSQEGLVGTLYYWSPSTQGLWRLQPGGAPESFLGPSETGSCVGCHTANLSNPDRVAMNYGGGDGWSVVTDIGGAPGGVRPAGSQYGNFSTLDPSGSLVVRSFQGVLYLDDLASGSVSALPTSGWATHPDWSPDGNALVYASCSGSTPYDWVQEGCSIRRLDFFGGAFGNDVPLVGSHSYYPAFSPDSQWVLFNRSTGDMYDDLDAELWVVAAAGSAAIRLDAANAGTGLYNSWGRWGDQHGDYAWIALSSRRPYGAVTSSIPQIWIGALDLQRAAQGLDPSHPLLWQAGQDTGVGNHTPLWIVRED